jgi:S1-C subfamily serine protease
VPDGDVGGLAVYRVEPGSKATAAGLRSASWKSGATEYSTENLEALGDIIVAVDGKPALETLGAYVASKRAGDTVSLDVIRKGSRHTVTLTLGK